MCASGGGYGSARHRVVRVCCTRPAIPRRSTQSSSSVTAPARRPSCAQRRTGAPDARSEPFTLGDRDRSPARPRRPRFPNDRRSDRARRESTTAPRRRRSGPPSRRWGSGSSTAWPLARPGFSTDRGHRDEPGLFSVARRNLLAGRLRGERPRLAGHRAPDLPPRTRAICCTRPRSRRGSAISRSGDVR